MEISDSGASECAEATQLLSEITKNASGINETFQALLKELCVKYQTGKGISFLEVKFHTVLDYLINLTYITLKKVSGKSIENDPAIERIVELRTVLEKMKPIDQKLRHHVNKLLDTVATGTVKPNDPLRFKANPQNMITKESDSESGDDKEDEEEEKPKSNVYVPPKITAMHYDGDETLQYRKQKALENVQKRALSSSILYELKKQYDDGPEEIRESADLHKLKENKELKERVRYEEEYMMRLPVPKKQRHDTRQVATMSNLSSITRFEDISALEMGVDDVPLKKKGSKKLSTKKGKRKSFRNRRHRH